MTQKERTENAKNAIMLAGLKHFGQKGFAGTTVAALEETGLPVARFHSLQKICMIFCGDS